MLPLGPGAWERVYHKEAGQFRILAPLQQGSLQRPEPGGGILTQCPCGTPGPVPLSLALDSVGPPVSFPYTLLPDPPHCGCPLFVLKHPIGGLHVLCKFPLLQTMLGRESLPSLYRSGKIDGAKIPITY